MFKTLCCLFVSVFLASTAFAQSSYKIRSGDTLQIEVLEDANLNRSALVLPDGSISFPLVGGVSAAGRTTDQVRAALTSALAKNFASEPNVFVSVATVGVPTLRGAATTSVFVMGEITTPGKIDVSRGTTLLQALAQAGGFTRFAAEKRIQLRRSDRKTGQEKTYLYNYQSGGGISGNTVLNPGDVIVVPTRRLFE